MIDTRYDYADRLLYCICGHSEDDHSDSDESSKVGCEAVDDWGSLCRCEDFELPGEIVLHNEFMRD